MPNGLRDYLGSCWRRKVSRVLEGPLYLRWEKGHWSGHTRDDGFFRTRRRGQWHWQRAEFTFLLWPCRHKVTFRLRSGEFPTRAMARQPYATAAWPGRELPCTICGPAPRKEDSFDHRPVGWSYAGIGRRRRRRVKAVASRAQLPEAPPQVQQFEAEIAMRRQYQHLADLYDT